MNQDKAQPAANGYSLSNGCNAELDHLCASLRARLEATICGVAFLEKGMPFSTECAGQLVAYSHAGNIKQHGAAH